MHIGIDIRMIGRKRTGDETVFFNLVKHLAEIDRDNRYTLFLDQRTPSEIAEITRSLEIENRENFCIVSLPTTSKFIWNFYTLPAFLREHSVDVYHTQYIVPFFVPRSIKIVTHIHDISFKIYPEYIAPKDRFFLSLLIPRSLRRADTIVAVSEFTKREIIEHYGIAPEKIAVVLNALSGDLAHYEAASDERKRAVREKYHLPQNYILYLGTLQPRKNVPTLIRAFAQVADRLPSTSLVIVGNRRGHHYDTTIDTTVAEANLGERVVFPGFIDQEDVAVIFQMASEYALPSLYEGFGLPPLEAMAQHVPAIVADIPSLRESCGEAARFVAPLSLADWSEALYAACTESSSDREARIAKGVAQTGRFSWRESAVRLQETYKNICV